VSVRTIYLEVLLDPIKLYIKATFDLETNKTKRRRLLTTPTIKLCREKHCRRKNEKEKDLAYALLDKSRYEDCHRRPPLRGGIHQCLHEQLPHQRGKGRTPPRRKQNRIRTAFSDRGIANATDLVVGIEQCAARIRQLE